MLLTLLLLALSVSLALSLTMRVFGFYTLPHAHKLIIVGYLALVLAMAFFRFAKPGIVKRSGRKGHHVMAIGVAVLATLFFFILVRYHIAPLRTTHVLKIQNNSSSPEVSVWEIVLPGEESLDLSDTFGVDWISDNRLLIPSGGSIDYSREMAGGVTVRLGAMDWPAQAEVVWDDLEYEVAWEDDGDAVALQLPGWTWGSPSLPYRVFGFLNIAADIVSVFGLALLAGFLFLPFPEQEGEQGRIVLDDPLLKAFTLSIIVNLIILVGALIYAGFFRVELSILMLLIGIGILFFLRDLARSNRKWLLWTVMAVLVIGIAVNGYFYLNPPHELHQTLLYRPYNSFEYLADRIGALNPTYLSIGYYQYLRGSTLVIAEPLYEELDLQEGRLRQLNRLQDFRYQDYAYQLSDSEAEALLSQGEWSTWPNRLGGGEYYLLPEASGPGETYYFFSHGQQYFLIPLDLIEDLGVIDVPLSD
jgi:hypothetical protein